MTLDLIAQFLSGHDRRLASANVGSQGGLVALRRGEAHLAGSHLLNPETGDLSLTVFIAVKTNQHNERWAQHFQRVTENIPGVLEVYRMGGEVDYLVKAVVKDMPGYDVLYQELIKADLFDVSASFVMEPLKQTTELPL
jgi:DNA-binding Lrp family transcriptional regulator